MGNLETTLFVVPARGGSKGIPNKNLREIHGKSLAEWALIVARQFGGARVALSSDSDEILAVADRYPGVIGIKRPDEISKDTSTDQEALSHALHYVESTQGLRLETIVMLQPTAPSRSVQLVQKALEIMFSEEASAVWSVDEVDLKVHARKQLTLEDSGELRLAISSRVPLRRQDLSMTYVRNGECYALSRDVVLGDPLLLGPNARMVLSQPGGVNIDTPQDLIRAEEKLKIGPDGSLVRR